MKTRDKNTNIETLRCVLMLMIVTLHYLNKSLSGVFVVLKSGLPGTAKNSANYYMNNFSKKFFTDKLEGILTECVF